LIRLLGGADPLVRGRPPGRPSRRARPSLLEYAVSTIQRGPLWRSQRPNNDETGASNYGLFSMRNNGSSS